MDEGTLFTGPFFTLRYPSHWEELIVEDIPSFFNPEGTGALQIAAVSREGEPFQAEEELKRYLERQGLEYDPDRVASYISESGLTSLACEFTLKERFWLVHYSGQGSRMLFALYNDVDRPDEETIQEILSVLRSIRFT